MMPAAMRQQECLAAIEAELRQIHRATPYGKGHVCVTCLDPATLCSELWPCPTVRVVRRMLHLAGMSRT